jgi:hypothetical protein
MIQTTMPIRSRRRDCQSEVTASTYQHQHAADETNVVARPGERRRRQSGYMVGREAFLK